VKSAMEEDQGVLGLCRCKGRIFGFLEQQESPSGAQLVARRHTRDVWCSDSQKNVVFCIFVEQKPPDAGFVPPSARLLIVGR